jgi:hypothetical protein
VDCGPAIGFDIVTDERGADHAFMTCKAQLYRLDIKTGAAQPIGRIVSADTEYIGLSVLSE